ncbi:MAG TPA: tryptophan synthase subunit alpha [Caldimonas sp.]|jgi:tryptophan synthase alpha chain|nr:tryptophan synthase subunit alpha [Caldimonas sp.]HEX2540271.1 tryptophan synthase subunit alpha [Caldimonas sp.]
MSRIEPAFAGLRERRRKALIPYVTAGDPQADTTAAIMLAMAGAGADVIELGVPFSDPMADGPVIQKASERALGRGIGMTQVLAMVTAFRAQDARTPVVLMGYANPIERHGTERFVADAKAAGVDGVLVVDYPPEECGDFAALLKRHGMDPIFLIAPTSSDARIARLAGLASGYVYHVSLKGVTGAGHFDIEAVKTMIPRIREHLNLPVGVGFGIRDARTARAVADVADAVVIGSALVQLLESAGREDAPGIAAGFIADIRRALDA